MVWTQGLGGRLGIRLRQALQGRIQIPDADLLVHIVPYLLLGQFKIGNLLLQQLEFIGGLIFTVGNGEGRTKQQQNSGAKLRRVNCMWVREYLYIYMIAPAPDIRALRILNGTGGLRVFDEVLQPCISIVLRQ